MWEDGTTVGSHVRKMPFDMASVVAGQGSHGAIQSRPLIRWRRGVEKDSFPVGTTLYLGRLIHSSSSAE